MNTEEFINQIKEILPEQCFISENSDLWSYMDGFLFYRDENADKPFAEITGVRYVRDGSALEGDFSGFLALLTNAVNEEFYL